MAITTKSIEILDGGKVPRRGLTPDGDSTPVLLLVLPLMQDTYR